MKVGSFVQEVKQETQKVTWPTRKETMMSMVMVLILTTIAAVFFVASDSIIAYVLRWILT